MDDDELLLKLEELAEALEVEVRYEATEGRSGGGVLRGRKVAVIDSALPLRRRMEALAAVLAREDVEGVYLAPAVREVLESH